jgi:hypothetical protein
MAPQVRLERTTSALTVPRNYQLCYWGMERDARIELATLAWKARVIPFYESRLKLVPVVGFELTTFALQEHCSGQLS